MAEPRLGFLLGTIGTIVLLVLEVGAGGLAFIGVAWLLKMEELRALIELVLRRRPLAEVPA